jgi:hypothetical protein
MSWKNFDRLAQPMISKEIEVKGPGKLTHGSAVTSSFEKLIPHLMETLAGGSTKAPPAEAVAFAKRQTMAVRRLGAGDKVRTRPWFTVAMTQSNNNLDTLLAKTIEHLHKNINAQSLAETQAVFNELSRTPEGAATVRRHANPDSLSQAIKLSKERK